MSVIIVNWNGEKHLRSCLSSLYVLDYPSDKVEIIFSDNGSKDNSLDFLKKNFPKVKIVENGENLGFAEGNNRGFIHANGKYLALLNNDSVADKSWLKNSVDVLEKDEKIAAVGSKILIWNDQNPAFDLSNKIAVSWPKVDPWTGFCFNFVDNRPQSKVDYLPGAAMIVRKKVYDQIGGMDKEFFAYFEETDWCARMIKAGYDCVYVPTSVIWHKVEASALAHSSDFHDKMMVRNRLLFILKNFDLKNLIFFVFYYFLEVFAKSVFYVLNSLILVYQKTLNKPGLDESQQRVTFYFREIKFAPWAVFWNFSNLVNIFSERKKEASKVKLRSYNDNLPLKSVVPNLQVLK